MRGDSLRGTCAGRARATRAGGAWPYMHLTPSRVQRPGQSACRRVAPPKVIVAVANSELRTGPMASADETVEVAGLLAPRAVAVRVWDLPTRLFHWLLVVSVVGSFATGYIGGNAMAWHLRFRYVSFALLVFRLLWGFCGGRWSRFRSFAYAPAASLRYLRGQSRPWEH